MLIIDDSGSETRFIDFGDAHGNVKFQLPVLGDPGVPMGLMSAFGMFWDKLQNRKKMTDRGVMSAWSFLIETLSNSYPDATIELAQLDDKQLKQVIEYWVRESSKLAGYDPKAR